MMSNRFEKPQRHLPSAPPNIRLAWQNELGGLTFQIGEGVGRCFLKWTPITSGIDLSQEISRLKWAADYTPVPRLLSQGTDRTGSWILTEGLPGENAVSDRWTARPDQAVMAIGRGLRALHDALPVDTCPFSWSVVDRLADARRRADRGQLDPRRWHPCHRTLSVSKALDLLADPPPIDRLVVCHGDACAPNTLVDDEGHWAGHVDVGALGVADRWADLAIATWSTVWNYGPGWETLLLDAYGVPPDFGRSAYYRLLWDLGP